MNFQTRITGIREDEFGTHLRLIIPGEQVQTKILKYKAGNTIRSELRVYDNRSITTDQRKKYMRQFET
jgi:hypothetical protein